MYTRDASRRPWALLLYITGFDTVSTAVNAAQRHQFEVQFQRLTANAMCTTIQSYKIVGQQLIKEWEKVGHQLTMTVCSGRTQENI